jgi:hypothetical protein
MAETGNTGEKLVSGPPPKLDLRKAGVSPAAQSATPVKPFASKPVPAAEAAKPSAPVIKLGYTADTDAKKPQPAGGSAAHANMPKPGGAMAAVRKPSAAAPLTRVPGATQKMETSNIEFTSSSIAKTVVLDESPAERDLPISKRETSRIPLEKAAPAAAPAVPVERAAKAASSIAAKVAPAPEAETEAEPVAAAEEKPAEEKRMTSRISLEAALMPDAAAATAKPGDTGPKTIRLKRPGDSATVKIAPKPRMVKPEEAGTPMNRTARLEVPEEQAEAEEEGGSTTKRKTIRIKRPTQAASEGGAEPMVIARTPGGPADQDGGMTGMPFSIEDEPNPIFPVIAIAALLVIGVTIWMLSAQAFPTANISWPGKLPGI